MTTRARTSGPDPREIYFLGDAHLGAESSALESAKSADLHALLRSLEGRASRLYVVGDLFDFWFEFRRSAATRHAETLRALAGLSASGTVITFIGGNHDYWAGAGFEEATGATVSRRPVSETHFGRRLFIAHGDGLPAGDLGYRILKSVIRSRPAIAGFKLVPPAAGALVARWASGLTGVTEERVERAIPPMMDFLRRVVVSGYDAAVVGHVHRPIMSRFAGGTGVVVGDWMAHRSVVRLTEDGFAMLRWTGNGVAETGRERDLPAA